MGSIYRPTGRNGKPCRVFWAKWYQNGRAIRESTGTDKKGEAVRFLALREGAKAHGITLPPRADRLTYPEVMADLMAHYERTKKRKLRSADSLRKPLDRYFSGYRAAGIGPLQAAHYATHRQAAGVSNATINRELSMLKTGLRLAVEHGKLHQAPRFAALKETDPRQGFFEAEQWQAVKRRLSEDLQLVGEIGYIYGWRIRSEVLTLTRRQLDLKAGTMVLDPGSTKNDKARIAPLTPGVAALLKAQLARVDKLSRDLGRIIPYLFPHLSGPHQGERIRDFRRVWERACRLAGVPGRLRHDFRRTAVRNFVRAGIPDVIAMQLTGHKSRSVFDRYNIVNEQDLREAVNKLGHDLGTTARKTVDAAGLSVQP